MKTRTHIFISGRVQGVFFRSETRRIANEYDVKGWISNLPDGRVEGVFEGDEDAVSKVVKFCEKGPSGAVVTCVEVKREPYSDEFNSFEILW